MIKAHADACQLAESFALYRDLRRDTGFFPDGYTFVVLAKSCGLNLAVWEGEEIHGQVVKKGFCSNLYVLTALVDMRAKFAKRLGGMVSARKLFDEMGEKDSAACNAMIDGYAKLGDMGSARDLFEEMEERNVVSWTSMIYGYCKGGHLELAKSLFDAMPEKNLVSWNAMISGYCRNKQPREALRLFREMQAKALLEPNEVTVVTILPAIADLGALDLGCWVHQFAQRKKFDRETNICTALVDMYAKCGEVVKAKKAFDEMPEKGIASWNAMIHGLAVNGHGKAALELFMEMQHKNLKPNDATMLSVLSACNHSGLVEEGKRWFNAMEGFNLIPQIEHYGCMVDLLGRAGFLEDAEKLIDNMPYEANGIILSSFLSACGYFKDVSRAKKFLKNAVKLEPGNDGNYVTVRNLYASERRWIDAEGIKKLMKKNGANKEVGYSFIVVDGKMLDFVSGNEVMRIENR